MYHDVFVDDADASGFAGRAAGIYKLHVGKFNDHLRALHRRFPEGPAVLYSHSPFLTRMPFMLTFDDGGVSAWGEIADLLENLRWRAHFFITTDRIDQQAFLSRAQIRTLHARGHAIGSHSVSHPPIMSALSDRRILSEWADSLAELSDIVGEDIRLASVPGGYSSLRVIRMAEKAGVRFLWTSEPTRRVRQVGGVQVLGRYMVQERTDTSAVVRLATEASWAHIEQWSKWNGLKIVKRLSGRLYPWVREQMLGARSRRDE